MQKGKVRFLLVNPWIYDFAAYDFWSKPLGLLKLASLLEENDVTIDYIDCLETSSVSGKTDGIKLPKRKPAGCGNFLKQRIEKPEKLKNIQRYYSRYGISPSIFEGRLSKLLQPHAILLTSFMTYWYPGLIDTVKILRKHFGKTPIILGGIYATLCEDHAKRNIDADYVITGNGEPFIIKYLSDKFKIKTGEYDYDDPDSFPFPLYSLYDDPDSALIETSRGCPFNCKYCSSKYLVPSFKRRKIEKVIEEIEYLHYHLGIKNFSFADDALLWGREIRSLLKLLVKKKLKCSFFTPNGIHASRIDDVTAELMFEAGFSGLKLGIESKEVKFHKSMDNKTTPSDFVDSVKSLQKAGFKHEDIGAYVMVGLPWQTYEEAVKSLDFVIEAGAKPYITQYSPIPHSTLFEEACRASSYDLASDPIYHNNSILPLRWEKFGFEELFKLKAYIKKV